MRWIVREVLPGLDTPVVTLTLFTLLVTTLVLHLDVPGGDIVQRWASTNLVNLNSHPVEALFASIFVTSGAGATVGIVLALTGPALERRAGHLRAFLIPLIGHVVATLASEGGLRAAIWAHASARSEAFQLDIGTSYVAFTAWGALLRYIPRKWRGWYAAGLLGSTLIPLVIMRDMVGWGHLASAVIGVLSWHWLPDSTGRSRKRFAGHHLRLPMGLVPFLSRTASVAVIGALTVAGVVAIYTGSSVLPHHHDLSQQSVRAIGTPGR